MCAGTMPVTVSDAVHPDFWRRRIARWRPHNASMPDQLICALDHPSKQASAHAKHGTNHTLEGMSATINRTPARSVPHFGTFCAALAATFKTISAPVRQDADYLYSAAVARCN